MTVAYCAASFAKSVRKAAGVKPLLSPPLTADTFDPAVLIGHRFIYFKLHGLEGQPYWYGDEWITALSAAQLQLANLKGAVVFVANCYLLDSPMLDALVAAKARYVIGGAGLNYAKSREIAGADRLGRYIRQHLKLRMKPTAAFRAAKFRLKARRKSRANLDTLEFKLHIPATGEWIS